MTNEPLNLSQQSLAQLLTYTTGALTGAVLTLEDYAENEVEISNLQISKTGMGLGSKTLQNLTYQADRFGINLMLIPAGDGLRRDRLIEFYKRFGFQEDGDLMRYRARSAFQKPV
jgi:GNAT superfamily N-acetyltransferase